MAFSYDKLWKLHIDKKINKVGFRDAIGIAPTTLSKLTNNKKVSMDVLEKNCIKLKCDIADIVEYKHEQEDL